MREWYEKPEPERPPQYTRKLTYTPNAIWILHQAGFVYRLDKLEIPIEVRAHGTSFQLSPSQLSKQRLMHGSVALPAGFGIAAAEMLISESDGGERRGSVIINPDEQNEYHAVTLTAAYST